MTSSHANPGQFQSGYPPFDYEALVNQAPVPVANMTGSGARQDAQSASAEPETEELDTRFDTSAEKANNKRDKEDGDYTLRKRKSAQGSASTATKRQRQSATKASESSGPPTTTTTKTFEECDETTRGLRKAAVESLKEIWGADPRNWPVFEFSPTRLVKTQWGPQKGREIEQKDGPLDWSLGLIHEIVCLAKNTTDDQRHRSEQVLREIIDDRVRDTDSEKMMCTTDIRRTNDILTRELSEAGPSHRSPTLAAAVTSNQPNVDRNDIPQPHSSIERVDSPLMSDEVDIQPGGGQGSAALDRGLSDDPLPKNFDSNSVEENERYIKGLQEIVEEKKRQHLALSEKLQSFRTKFAPRV
ncbi:hypothetical protein M409DRAFT_19497 [Zasmidium cellare ATCC 36951]|uniref:Uncharacterized protein n=1 Tax=Zasmidium cellare ATCC 36951 TaxID=1080233 RepID=A0A6A6CXT7_ZASCE|nr:uncharacterized protein M409DRAFT_19497 [Zasmidium cellare ATCC 36951]KAF2170682.1 hypothetical protein M409DRAFT_19497 [Zasmidium cellare ATCC 36951]